MSGVPEDDLSLAIARFDLEAFVVDRGARRESSTEYRLDCPKCGKDNLAVNIARRRWRCFTCERFQGSDPRTGRPKLIYGGGSTFALVAWVDGLTNQQAAQKILAEARPPELTGGLPELPAVGGLDAVQKLPAGMPENCVAIAQELPYMRRRSITLADARGFGLGYVPPERGWLSNRIVFPVWHRGQCLYWQARACWDEHEHVSRPWVDRDGVLHEDKFRKSLNPARERDGRVYFGSGDVLWNLEQAATYPRVAIVEGPTSGIRTGPDAVATFGKHLTLAQVSLLIAAGVRAVDFMWDGPSPREPMGGWPQMITAAASLAPHMDVRLVFIPKGDPGDYSREHLGWFRANARPFEVATQMQL